MFIKKNISRFLRFAVEVWGVHQDYYNPTHTALEGISRLEEYFKKVDLPTRLSEINIGKEKFSKIAKKSTEQPLGEFVKLNESDVINILKIAS